jgi:hypothetical protein
MRKGHQATTAVYIIVLIVALIASITLVILAWLSLQNPNNVEAVAGLTFYSRVLLYVCLGLTLILLILANIAFVRTTNAWPLWSTFAFWAVAIFFRFCWLEYQYIDFVIHRLNDIYDAPVPYQLIAFCLFVIPALIGVAVNHLLVWAYLRFTI